MLARKNTFLDINVTDNKNKVIIKQGDLTTRQING